jgi:hypothetical protein
MTLFPTVRGWALAVLVVGCSSGGGVKPPPAPGGEGGASGEGGSGGGASGSGGASASGGASGSGGAPRDAATVDAPPAAPPTAGACARLFTGGAISAWVSYDAEGHLAYKPLNAQGDRIMDFSAAGYRGGGVALPEVPVVQTLRPSGGDDTAAIQAALDAVAKRPLADGLRGAVLLEKGLYKSASTIEITASGVVLRGSGAGMDGTVIDLTATSHIFLRMRGGGTLRTEGPVASITDDYVPAGARSFTVDNIGAFKVGDPVVIGRPVTAAWLALLGMDKLVRDGSAQSWLTVGSVNRWERTIAALAGNQVTLDVPVSDSFDAKYVRPPGGTMQKYSFEGRISQVGLENLRVTAPLRTAAQAGEPDHGGSQFLEATNTIDSWIKGVWGHNTVEGIHLEAGSHRITVQDTTIDHEATDYFTASAPFDYNINASQVLIQRSASKGGNKIMTFTTHHAMGPNVLLDFDGAGVNSHIQPHLRWATGLLVDSAVNDSPGTGNDAAVGFMNRGTAGSGHGWSIGWGVAWNCTAPVLLIQQPAGSMNWAIGCKGMPSPPTNAPGVPGAPMPNGIFESTNTPVAPRSLYLAQLCERLGPQALANVGYK